MALVNSTTDTPKKTLAKRQDRQSLAGLVAFYDIRPGNFQSINQSLITKGPDDYLQCYVNGAGLLLQPRNPHEALQLRNPWTDWSKIRHALLFRWPHLVCQILTTWPGGDLLRYGKMYRQATYRARFLNVALKCLHCCKSDEPSEWKSFSAPWGSETPKRFS